MKIANYIYSGSMLLIGIIAIYFTKDFVNNIQGDVGPSFYPIIVSTITIILAILLLISSYRMKNAPQNHNFSKTGLYKIGIGVVYFAIYFYFIPKIGFIISSIIFMVLFMLALGLRDWKKVIIIPIVTTIVIYYLFAIILKIRLPEILF